MAEGPEIWFKPRGYAHFDKPIGYAKSCKIVKNSAIVARHGFFPLLSYQIVSRKAKKDDESGHVTVTEKNRDIRYASHIDSHIYAYYSYILSGLYEKKIKMHGLDTCVTAFRTLGKSNIHFANDAFETIKSHQKCSVLALDITGFFDNIDHEILKNSWSLIIDSTHLPIDHFAVFKSITKYSYIDKLEVFDVLGASKHNPPRARAGLCAAKDFRALIRPLKLIKQNKDSFGIPQGSPISAILSNIYMFNFDIQLNELVNNMGGRYFRYCDDILIIIPSHDYGAILSSVEKLISLIKLKSNPKKQEITLFTRQNDGKQVVSSGRPMQYLGFTYDGNNKLIRSAAFARYSMKMKSGVSLARQTAKKHNRERVSRGISVSLVYRKSLYDRYSHLGKRNFISYAIKASEIMDSKAMRKQIKPLWERLQKEIKLADGDQIDFLVSPL